ncbi:MAG: hypothetical protein N2Z75_03260 [Meiothermus sp.]|uniref:hypothetical protein n=1 Tax=Meiothermus sp. TaxID=1955249 RepID=UPI0025D9E75A|nr:hypothetical protein [Meiothermus sp.]MCS7067957.1 hypothetical protein [Meiothermus sp.]MCX7600944.1 hypothetical protein [Meiothermus sp.]MDW8426283.1 hypothetical protein [Meiothermus sp.]
MSQKIRRKLAAIVTTVVFGFILFKLLERTFVLIWVNTPWWGALLMLVVLFLLIDYLISRAFGVRD